MYFSIKSVGTVKMCTQLKLGNVLNKVFTLKNKVIQWEKCSIKHFEKRVKHLWLSKLTSKKRGKEYQFNHAVNFSRCMCLKVCWHIVYYYFIYLLFIFCVFKRNCLFRYRFNYVLSAWWFLINSYYSTQPIKCLTASSS